MWRTEQTRLIGADAAAIGVASMDATESIT
jgi:hypothetical protein